MALALRRHPQIFEKSKLKDGYRSILNQAQQDGAVLIRDSGDENLYIVREDIFGAYEIAHEESQDFAQFVAAMEYLVRTKSRPDALRLGRLSWAADLSIESFRVFVSEYVEAYVRAVHGGQWSALRQLLTEWRDTAALERDADLLADVLDTGTAESHLDLVRPSEEEDGGAGGSARGSATAAVEA